MSNAAVAAISVALYILLAPGVGGLLQGVDRKATARMQGRQGPPLLQSFYDVGKLLGKETKYMNHIQIVCHVSFLIFVIFTGALFFGGGDLLLIFFALTTANLCLILAATTCNSPYAAMGANREMLQTMAYEPIIWPPAALRSATLCGQAACRRLCTCPVYFAGFCSFSPSSCASTPLTCPPATTPIKRWSRG